MKIKYYYEDEIKKLFQFNDDTGLYFINTEHLNIKVRSWDYKLIIKTKDYGKLDPEELRILNRVFNEFSFEDED